MRCLILGPRRLETLRQNRSGYPDVYSVDERAMAMTLAMDTRWRKSARCTKDPSCVYARRIVDRVEMGDSADGNGTVLTFEPQSWMVFIGGVRRGEFDSVMS
jgi:hypothetical protein